MSKLDGESAFPRTIGHSEGMSLRDYFAGQAMNIIAGRSWDHIEGDKVDVWARSAYAIADAMLEERSRT